jgi:hypothetical protein
MARKLAGDETHGDESVGEERPPHPSLAIYELARAL